MKRIVVFALLLLLALSLAACGESKTVFSPQTPQEFFGSFPGP